MAKRGPTSELNHENWNDELEPEEAGTFQTASAAELQQRKILQPKRKLAAKTPSDNPFQSLGLESFGSFTTPDGAQQIPPPTSFATVIFPAQKISSENETESGIIPKPLESQCDKSVDLKMEITEAPIDRDSNAQALQANNQTPNSAEPVIDSAQISQENISKSVSESANDTSVSDEALNQSVELDLPDFVDQSDDEEAESKSDDDEKEEAESESDDDEEKEADSGSDEEDNSESD